MRDNSWIVGQPYLNLTGLREGCRLSGRKHISGLATTRQTGLLPCSRQSAQNPTGTSPIAVYGPPPPDFECPLQELRATQKQDGQSQPKFGLRLCHSVACS